MGWLGPGLRCANTAWAVFGFESSYCCGQIPLPAAFSHEVHAGCDLVAFRPVTSPVAGLQIVECVRSAPVDRGDVVDGEGQRVQVVGLVINGLSAHPAGWFVSGDDLAVPVAAGGVPHRSGTVWVFHR